MPYTMSPVGKPKTQAALTGLEGALKPLAQSKGGAVGGSPDAQAEPKGTWPVGENTLDVPYLPGQEAYIADQFRQQGARDEQMQHAGEVMDPYLQAVRGRQQTEAEGALRGTTKAQGMGQLDAADSPEAKDLGAFLTNQAVTQAVKTTAGEAPYAESLERVKGANQLGVANANHSAQTEFLKMLLQPGGLSGILGGDGGNDPTLPNGVFPSAIGPGGVHFSRTPFPAGAAKGTLADVDKWSAERARLQGGMGSAVQGITHWFGGPSVEQRVEELNSDIVASKQALGLPLDTTDKEYLIRKQGQPQAKPQVGPQPTQPAGGAVHWGRDAQGNPIRLSE